MSSETNYTSIELPNQKLQVFRYEDERPFERRISREQNYIFLLIEIQSDAPPTDCMLAIRFYTLGSNTVQHKTIHSMEFRKHFIFENGLYNLYLDLIKDFTDIPKDIRPIDLKFINRRDEKSVARLFYKVVGVDQ